MSQWQLFKKDVAQAETFDDGIWSGPGEDGFTTEHVAAEMKRRRCSSYSYIGRSTQVVERTEDCIAKRLEPAIEHALAEHAANVKAMIVAAIPEGEQRLVSEVDAEVEARVAEDEAELRAKLRAAVLKDMGLAEGQAQ